MEIIKDFFVNAFSSRIRVISVVMGLFATVLISRLFYLQIINGSEYQDNYNLKLEKTETIPATRGNIYDRNGNLLAYNELVYAVTIQDNGSYASKKEKSQSLNSEIAEIISSVIFMSGSHHQFLICSGVFPRFGSGSKRAIN